MARESDRSVTPRSASSGSVSTRRRAPRSCSPEAATSPSRRWGCSAPCSSATSSPTSSSGCSAGAFNGADHRGHAEPAAASSGSSATWASLRGEEVFPGGRLSRAWNLLTRDDHLFSNQGLRDIFLRGRHPRHVRGADIPLRVVAADLDTGDEVVFAVGPAPARAPGQRRPARDLPAHPPRRPHPGRRRGRRHRAPVARAAGPGRPDLRDERGR